MNPVSAGHGDVQRQAANLAVIMRQTKYKQILNRCKARTPAETAINIEREMKNYVQLHKILKRSGYYGNGTYLPLMRLVSLL